MTLGHICLRLSPHALRFLRREEVEQMSQALQAAAEVSSGRDCLDRRSSWPVDINPTTPMRRSTDAERMAYRLADRADKQKARQYAETPVPVTGFGEETL